MQEIRNLQSKICNWNWLPDLRLARTKVLADCRQPLNSGNCRFAAMA
jgi:hypothetical protein